MRFNSLGLLNCQNALWCPWFPWIQSEFSLFPTKGIGHRKSFSLPFICFSLLMCLPSKKFDYRNILLSSYTFCSPLFHSWIQNVYIFSFSTHMLISFTFYVYANVFPLYFFYSKSPSLVSYSFDLSAFQQNIKCCITWKGKS